MKEKTYTPAKLKPIKLAIKRDDSGLRNLELILLLFSALSFISPLFMHSVSSPRYGITPTIPSPQRFGWIESLACGVLFAAGYYAVHRRFRITWTLGWIAFGYSYIDSLRWCFLSTRKLPDRWIALATFLIAISLVTAYWGLWWKRQKGHFVNAWKP
jgi:hypothetical protein